MTNTQALLDANETIADLAKRVAELEAALTTIAQDKARVVTVNDARTVARRAIAGGPQ